jgi:outer membrane lipoprotein-sorting protein
MFKAMPAWAESKRMGRCMMAGKLLVAAMLMLVISGMSYPAAAADDAGGIFLSEAAVAENADTIKRIEEYLTGLTTIASEFTQAAPDGSLAAGKFFLQRPGKMRWQYNPPTPILMIATGSEMIFYDFELEQVSHIPLDNSLVSFLARPHITFDGDVGITYFSNEASAIRIQVAQRKKPSEGKLQLEFSDKPLTLRSMVVTDATGQVTSVALTDAKFGAKIDPALFVFKDPRKKRR